MAPLTLLSTAVCLLLALAATSVAWPGNPLGLKRDVRWPLFGLSGLSCVDSVGPLGEHYRFASVLGHTSDSPRLLWLIWLGCFLCLLILGRRKPGPNEIETRYRSLFESSPVSLWEEDFSDIKRYIDGLKAEGVSDFREYFAQHPDAVRRCASMLKVLEVNQATLSLLRVSGKQQLLDSLDSIFTEESWDAFRGELIALAEGHTRFETISLLRTLNGDLVITELRLSVAAGHEKTWDRVFLSAVDITQQVETEQALRDSEKKYRDLADNALVGIYIGQNHAIKFCNYGFAKLFGYQSTQDLLDRHFSELVAPESWETVDNYVKLREAGILHAAHCEFRAIKADGSPLDVEFVGSLTTYQGKPAVHGMVIDITERKRAERLLRALNQTARAVDKALTPNEVFVAVAEELRRLGIWCVIFVADENGSRLSPQYLNFATDAIEAVEKLVGVEREGFSFPISKVDLYRKVVWERKTVFIDDVEEPLWQLLPRFTKHFAKHIIRMLKMTKAIAAPFVVEDKVIGALYVQANDLAEDGTSLVTAFAYQVASAWRKAQLFEQAQQEIAERKRIEEEIRQHGHELALLNRIISTSAITTEAKALLETACRELLQFFGVPHGLVTLLDRDQGKLGTIAESCGDGWDAISKPSTKVWDELLFIYLSGLKEPIVVSDVHQATATLSADPVAEQMEAALYNDVRLSALLKKRGIRSLLSLPLTVEGNVVGNLILESDIAQAFAGKDVNLAISATEQVAGALARIWLDENHRRLSIAIEQAIESVMVTDAQQDIVYVNPAFERLTGYRKAEIIGQNVRVLSSDKHGEDFYEGLRANTSAGKIWHGRIVSKSKQGTLFTVDAVVTPVTDENGLIVSYVHLLHDVTRELKLEEQYYQAQKMEAIGLLAGGVAHDFNNLLTAISGFAEMLHFSLPPSDPARDWAEKILEASQRAADLTRQLLAFSRKQMIQAKVLNLNDVVKGMEKMLRRIIGEDINLQTILEPGLWSVEADPTQMEQVLLNLVVNARDAMPNGGDLTVETANVVLDEEYVATHLEAKAGEHVRLTVIDTGIGMSQEVKSRIFEPFFTTKEVGKGTGLGLATAYGIVQQHGGHIWVYSEEGMGSVFRLYLPRVRKAAPALQKLPPVMTDLPRGTETVLLVEDAMAVQELAAIVLKNQGFTVLIASSGQEALRLAEEYQGEIHLLFTDLVMPGMNGKELADTLTEMRPKLKVLFTSGYADRTLARHSVSEKQIAFIEKPFSPHALVRKVREVLDA